jgi:hypothetical protein
MMREIIYDCGGYVRVHVCSIRRSAKGKRGHRNKITCESRAKLNAKNAKHRMADLLHCNFGGKDIALRLSYSDDEMPFTIEDAIRNVQNFIRRLRRIYKAAAIKKIKYIYVTEMSGNGRIHHHLIITGGVDRNLIEKTWGLGYCNSKRLQFSENGLNGIAEYFQKEPKGKESNKRIRRWNSSQGLDTPKVSRRDYVVTNKTAKYIDSNPDDYNYIRDLYPNYEVGHVEPTAINDVSTGLFITIYLYKPEVITHANKNEFDYILKGEKKRTSVRGRRTQKD